MYILHQSNILLAIRKVAKQLLLSMYIEYVHVHQITGTDSHILFLADFNAVFSLKRYFVQYLLLTLKVLNF